MRVTANSQMGTLVHPNFHHSRLRINKVIDGLDNLEGILAVYLLSVLEPFNHIIDKLLRHLIPEFNTVIAVINLHRIDIEFLKRRRRIRNLNRLLKLQPTHKLLALCKLQLRIPVIRFPLDNSLEILQRIFIVQDSGIRKGTPPICLVAIRTNTFSFYPHSRDTRNPQQTN